MESVMSHSEPSDVNAEQGQVIVEGPDGVAVTLTPEAAEETARRLMDAAGQARAHAREAGLGEQLKGAEQDQAPASVPSRAGSASERS
jgi:hypothetical protein